VDFAQLVSVLGAQMRTRRRWSERACECVRVNVCVCVCVCVCKCVCVCVCVCLRAIPPAVRGACNPRCQVNRQREHAPVRPARSGPQVKECSFFVLSRDVC